MEAAQEFNLVNISSKRNFKLIASKMPNFEYEISKDFPINDFLAHDFDNDS